MLKSWETFAFIITRVPKNVKETLLYQSLYEQVFCGVLDE